LKIEDLVQRNGLLSLAAVFKDAFSVDWLVDLTGWRPTRVLQSLDEGVQQGFLVALEPGIFRFPSEAKRKLFELQLDSTDEKNLNRQIADVLISELPETEDKAIRVSVYLLKTPLYREGLEWLLEAGNHFAGTHRIEQALTAYAKIIEQQPEDWDEQADRVFIEAAINLSKIATGTHETQETVLALERALIIAKTMDLAESEALIEFNLAKSHWAILNYEKALGHFSRGNSLAKSLNMRNQSDTYTIFFLYMQGRFREAVESYEMSIPDIEKYPYGGFHLRTLNTVGLCYAYSGKFTQGLGVVDALRLHCEKLNDQFTAASAYSSIGHILLDMGRKSEAINALEESIRLGRVSKNYYVVVFSELALAYAYYLTGDTVKSVDFLKCYLKKTDEIKISRELSSYLMRLCLAIEEGRFQSFEGITPQMEIERNTRSNNVAIKGLAYQFLGRVKRLRKSSSEKRIELFSKASNYFEESGHIMELARSYHEISNEYHQLKNEGKVKEYSHKAISTLFGIDPILLPDDLRSIVHHQLPQKELAEDLVELSLLIASETNNREMLQRVISTANMYTCAERGAIFLVDESNEIRLTLKTSKNLTEHDINHPGFEPTYQLMIKTVNSGKCCTQEDSAVAENDNSLGSRIRSCIAVPIIQNKKPIGVLYQDNRLLDNVFDESDYKTLRYFASMIAVILKIEQQNQLIQKLKKEADQHLIYMAEPLNLTLHYKEIIGETRKMKQLFKRIEQVSESKTTVLVLGETGVGKELVARAIHNSSPRKAAPFVKVHCASLPDSLITSELFGHEKGAFTGADKLRIGRFELANGGTLFLDEIGELSLDIQVRLLRILQTGEFERVGGSGTLKSDFRLILATNRNLEREVKENRFRSDLYYRINVFAIDVPPLRERKMDIPLLAEHFLKTFSKQLGKKLNRLDNGQLQMLKRYHWPGNVREFENVMEKTAILSQNGMTRIPNLDDNISVNQTYTTDMTLGDMERTHIKNVLESAGWKVKGKSGAAEILGIPPTTLDYRMKKLKIKRPAGIKIRRAKKG